MAQKRTRVIEVKPSVNVKFEIDDFRNLKRLAKANKTTPTEYLRGLGLAAVASYQHQQQAA